MKYPIVPAWLPGVVILGLLIVVGGALVARIGLSVPALMAGLLGLLILLVAVWDRRTQALPQLFLFALAVILAGYAVIGRGFAHLGVPPLFYVGEIVLFLGLLAVVLGGGIHQAFRSRILWILAAFMIWSAIQTLPYLGTYGMDAMRDAATWGYGAFAFLTAGFFLRRGKRSVSDVVRFYRRLAPWIILMIPVLIINSETLRLVVLSPGGVNIFSTRPGAMSVQLAGVGVFFTLGLNRLYRRQGDTSVRPLDWVLLGLWLLVALMTAVINRGGMLSIAMAFFCLLLIRPSRQLARLTGVAVAIFCLILVLNPPVAFDSDREYSPAQLVTNFLSIFDAESEGNMSQTREWRLNWWTQIVRYTVFGPYFWAGKGYGINLAISDNIRDAVDDQGYPLRSPHNSHMTVLARSGVPGFLLWLTLLSTFCFSLLQAYLRARKSGQDWLARINLGVLAFWVAFVTNMSFTVYLEGPHGGIWFWSLMGFGIALLEWQRAPERVVRKPALRKATYPRPSVTERYNLSKRA